MPVEPTHCTCNCNNIVSNNKYTGFIADYKKHISKLYTVLNNYNIIIE